VYVYGIMAGEDEPVRLEACKSCALKALDNENHD
jgi:hypothetical protein